MTGKGSAYPWGIGLAGRAADQEAEAGQRVGAGPVVDPYAALVPVQQPGFVQHLEVVADRRLDRSKASVRSQTQASPPWLEATSDISRSRTGSASALSSGATCSACIGEAARRPAGHSIVPGQAAVRAGGPVLAGRSMRPSRPGRAPPRTSAYIYIDRLRCLWQADGQDRNRQTSMSWLRRFPCPLVCSSLSTSTTSARRSRSTPGCSAPSGQGPARVRELRHRRAAAQARPAGEPRPGRQPEPPRRRGSRHRHGRGRAGPPGRGRARRSGRTRNHLLLRQAGQVLGPGRP